jgi:hypothetical protein
MVHKIKEIHALKGVFPHIFTGVGAFFRRDNFSSAFLCSSTAGMC